MKQRRRTHESKRSEDTRSSKDMLSDLPDSVLMHLLSFLQIKESVQTCLLSTRWKHLWKYLPTLTLNSDHFRTVKSFTEFVNQVLALRDASTAVNALDYLESFVDSDLPQKVVRANDGRTEPFSTFNKLSTLILSNCNIVPKEQTLCISSTTLLSLSINRCFSISKVELSSPNLCSFTFTGKHFPKLCGNSLDSIKKATIDVQHMDMVPSYHADTCLILLNWLSELVNIKSLTLSTATLRVLSLIPDLLKLKPPSWNNLKSLKVQRDQNQLISSKARLESYSFIPDGIIEFLLQNSHSVKLDIVD